MFDWQYLFEDKILHRAKAYVDDVSNVKRIGDKITCDVEGTGDYYVTVRIVDDYVESMSCTCPYEFRCKHEAALLYYIDQNPELLEVQDKTDDVGSILASVDCYTLRRFLKEELEVNEKLKDDFLKEFRTRSRVDKRFYFDKLNRIFDNAKGRDFNLHGYYDLDYIGNSLLRFLDEDVARIISMGEYSIACDLLNHLMSLLDDEMYMNYDAWFDIAYQYKEYSGTLLESGKLDDEQVDDVNIYLRKISNFV